MVALLRSLSLSNLLRRRSSSGGEAHASSPKSTEAHASTPTSTPTPLRRASTSPILLDSAPGGHWDDLSREEKILQIAHRLQQICQNNWDTREYQSTRFDAICAPDISLPSYVGRISQYCKLEDSTFLVALLLLKRLFEAQGDAYLPTVHNVHRLLITAILVASKINEDALHSNGFIAKVGGVHLMELNKMELDFCVGIQWQIYASETDLALAAAALQDFAAPEKNIFWNCWWRKAVQVDDASSAATQADSIGAECKQPVLTDLQTNLVTADRLTSAVGG